MDIDSIITEQEYNNMRNLSYDQFCIYIRRLVKLAVEESLKTLPTVVTHLAAQAAYLKELSDNFYKQNPDLAKEKMLMARCLEKVEGENPGLKYEDLLPKAARLARSRISAGKILEGGREKLDEYDKRLDEI